MELSAIRERIVGKHVVSVKDDRLGLDDGTVLHLYESASDCCATAYGEWLIEAANLDAVITDVKFDLIADHEEDSYGNGAASRAIITILHNQNPIALANCYANDGNGGYYYSCLSLSVLVAGAAVIDTEVISA